MEITPLKLLRIEERKWMLEEEYSYEINGYVINIPKGFVTDLASTPKVLWAFFPPYGKYNAAAVVHDYLYSAFNDTGINRDLADQIFNFILKELGISFYKRCSMYRAVRMFGEVFWKKKIRNEGYRKQALIDRTEEALKYYKKMNERLKL